MRRLVVSRVEDIPALSGGIPFMLFALPKGFRGYVRVKFLGAGAGDFLFGSWVPVSNESQAQNAGALSAQNFGVHWADTNEKLWEFPPVDRCLIVGGSATGGRAVIDLAGEVEDQ